MKKRLIALAIILLALPLAGCLTDPEPRVRVIDCGVLDLDEDDIYHVTDSTCTKEPLK